MNNKGADKTAWLRILVCAFVVSMQQRQEPSHARIQKVCQRGPNSDNVFLVDEGREDQNATKMDHHWPTSDLPLK